MYRRLPRVAKAAVATLLLLLSLSGCGGSKGPAVTAFPNASGEDLTAIRSLLKDDLPAGLDAYQRFSVATSTMDMDAARKAVNELRTARDAAEQHLLDVNSSSNGITMLEHGLAALTSALRAAEGVIDVYGSDKTVPILRHYRVFKAYRGANRQVDRMNREILLLALASASEPEQDALRATYRETLAPAGGGLDRRRRAAPNDDDTATMRALLRKGFRDASSRDVETAIVLSRDLRVLDRTYGDLLEAHDGDDRTEEALVEKADARELAANADLVELDDPDLRRTFTNLLDSTVGFLEATDDLPEYVDLDPKSDRRLKRELDAALRDATRQRTLAESALRQRLSSHATPDEQEFLQRQADASPV